MKYLIYAKYKNSNFEFLSKIAKSKPDAVKALEEYPRYGLTARMVPQSEFFKDCHDFEEKLCRLLTKLEISSESVTINGKHFSVEIFGDWKHDHMHSDAIITALFDCVKIGEDVTQEDGSDCYASIHEYCR